MRKFCLLILPILSTFIGYGQIDPRHLDLPNITAPSPDAASLGKYGITPVNMSVGSATIDVPVWTINCGPISWPVSISYVTGAIKVDEISSNVGLGWTLAGQGVITRTVRGRPDELTFDEPDYSTISFTNDWYYLYGVLDGKQDCEFDVYSYSFNGRSGRFYITQEEEIFAVPVTSLKISQTISGFEIIDEDGHIYSFFQPEMTILEETGIATHPTSWYLTKVETSDRKQSIMFHYIDDGAIGQNSSSFTWKIGSWYNLACEKQIITDISPQLTTNATSTVISQLQRIDFPNGSINFNYINDRVDINGTNKDRLTQIEIKRASSDSVTRKFSLYHSYFTSGNRLKLDSILEYRFSNGPKKKYSFEYDATPTVHVGSYAQDKWGYNNGVTTNTSLLASQTVWYNSVQYNIGDANRSVDTTASKAGSLIAVNWPTGGRTEYTYDAHQFYPGFMSNSTTEHSAETSTAGAPVITTFTYPSSLATDAKAIVVINNFNASGSSTPNPYVQLKDLTTGNIVLYIENNVPQTPLNTEQSLNLIPGRNYEMKSQIYTNAASGYSTSIKVEWAVYGTTPIIEKGGGIRIRTVKNYTKPEVLASTDYYQYEPGTTLSTYYAINLNRKQIFYRTHSAAPPMPCIANGPLCDVYYSASLYPTTVVAGSPIMYKKVTKYQLNESNVPKGKTEYEYNVVRDNFISSFNSISFIYFTKNDWKNGSLLSETHYKRENNGEYTPVKRIENTYNELKISSIEELQVKTLALENVTPYRDAMTAPVDMVFYYVPIFTGINQLIKTKEMIYGKDVDQPQINITDNFYSDISHNFITKTTRTDSKGDIFSNTMKYPVDFSSSGNVYEKMVNKNIISPVIEEKYSRREIVSGNPTEVTLQTIKKDYRDWKNDQLVLAPEFVKASINGNTPENRIVYTNYNDRKQPTEVKKNLDATLTYMYGYNSQYVVAEISNASLSNVAYTSFEAGDKGGWSYSGIPIRDATSPTGKMCYSYTGNIVSPSITTGIPYIVSYWKKSGTVSISGSTSTTGRTVNGWTYFEHRIASPGVNITVSGTSAVIDELRLYPANNAMMKTYAYDPLVGVMNECDANNRILSYEYDELQRLVLIRDQDRNIVKKFSYKYQLYDDFENIYYNEARSETFQRQTACSGCQVGSSVTYTVPANSYLSTVSVDAANAVAEDDIATNGQAYANAVGTCITPPNATILTTNAIPAVFNFFNTCTSTNYNRPRSTLETDWPISGVPQGTYTIDIIKSTPPATYQYYEVIAPANTPDTLYYFGPNFLPFTNIKFGIGTNKAIITN